MKYWKKSFRELFRMLPTCYFALLLHMTFAVGDRRNSKLEPTPSFTEYDFHTSKFRKRSKILFQIYIFQ